MWLGRDYQWRGPNINEKRPQDFAEIITSTTGKGTILKSKSAIDYVLYDQRSYNLGWSNGRKHGFVEALGLVFVFLLARHFVPWLFP